MIFINISNLNIKTVYEKIRFTINSFYNTNKNYIMYFILYLIFLIPHIKSHGYVSRPTARQHICYLENDFWWPKDGSGISNKMCKLAYKYVYNKVLMESNDENVAVITSQNMLYKTNEFINFLPDYLDISYLKKNIVKDNLCGAGLSDWNNIPYGDKSGIDLPGNWKPYIIKYNPNNINGSVPIRIELCPIIIHNDTYIEIYISKEEFNITNDKLKWSDLDIIFNNTVPFKHKSKQSTCISSNKVHEFIINVPVRTFQFVLYVRWQRNNTEGEGIYNCVDVLLKSDFNLLNNTEEIISNDEIEKTTSTNSLPSSTESINNSKNITCKCYNNSDELNKTEPNLRSNNKLLDYEYTTIINLFEEYNNTEIDYDISNYTTTENYDYVTFF